MNKELEFKLKKIPKKPGCYLYKDRNGIIIYVGKAKNLFNRVHQYFNNQLHDFKTTKLIGEINDLDFIVVNNETDSLLLENNLIKKYKPKFNILLKESAGYPYIVLTNEKNPRLIYTRDTKKYKGKYYGPFPNTTMNKYAIYNLLQQIFPLRKCHTLKKNKCIYYDIGMCLGPCINIINKNEYQKISKAIDNFFKGDTSDIMSLLKQRENEASNTLNFEDAQKYLDLIKSINELSNRQTIILNSKKNIDIVGFYVKDEYITFTIFSYINGKLLEKYQQISKFYESIDETLTSFIIQYYNENNIETNTIYVSISSEYINDLSKILDKKIINPIKGKFHNLLLLAAENSKKYFDSNFLRYQNEIKRTSLAFNELKNILNIDNLSFIVVYDMSNLFGDDKIGAAIGLTNGSFNKKLYRKFIIKNNSYNSDDKYMYETIKRHISKLIFNKEELPNLIIVDGGKIQVNAAVKSLKELHLENVIPVIGLSKDNNHKTDAIITSYGEKIELDKKSNLYLYLLNIQEEVHRYAITFFRNKKSNSIFHSVLNEIDGLGEKSIQKLIGHFSTIENIKKASIEEISQFTTKVIANKIKQRLEVNDKNISC